MKILNLRQRLRFRSGGLRAVTVHGFVDRGYDWTAKKAKCVGFPLFRESGVNIQRMVNTLLTKGGPGGRFLCGAASCAIPACRVCRRATRIVIWLILPVIYACFKD